MLAFAQPAAAAGPAMTVNDGGGYGGTATPVRQFAKPDRQKRADGRTGFVHASRATTGRRTDVREMGLAAAAAAATAANSDSEVTSQLMLYNFRNCQ